MGAASWVYVEPSLASPVPPDAPLPPPAPPGSGSVAPWFTEPLPPPPPDPAAVKAKYATAVPHEWGTAVTGARTRLASAGRRLALTFDACGGPGGGSAVDTAILDLLERERIAATLFLNSRWIEANPALAVQLAANPLFELGNHGTRHLPLSVTGRSAYGIAGTRSAAEVVDEVWANHQRLQQITGAAPRWFRPGTAHCDEVATAIVRDLGEEVVGFTVNGDAGATLPAAKVQGALTAAAPGSIVIMHMNRPKGDTAKGLAAALPALRRAGTEFVTLSGAAGLA
ncbi:polysaccharide deacetylase family protein [Rhodococcus spelaei]|uniref:Polysaccharide deacetylase family protein n=1 Tax=Rhodococcus spelaei TaxID=2546320 RepID=A0A541BPR1_9NOCA|nr:polysaccharide deacetylase family protein [Rhodococcus spelaei]